MLHFSDKVLLWKLRIFLLAKFPIKNHKIYRRNSSFSFKILIQEIRQRSDSLKHEFIQPHVIAFKFYDLPATNFWHFFTISPVEFGNKNNSSLSSTIHSKSRSKLVKFFSSHSVDTFLSLVASAIFLFPILNCFCNEFES